MKTISIAADTPALVIPDWQAKLEKASMNPDAMKDILRDAGRFLQAIENAGTPARRALGLVLRAVREHKLHLEWDFDGWMPFMEASKEVFFVSTRVAYEALEMADSEAIESLPPEKLAAMPLSNARALVKLEKATKAAGKTIDAEVVEQAVTLRPKDFRRETSAEEGATVRVWCKDKVTAEHVERIMKVLAGATPDAAKTFADFFESAVLVAHAGDGPDNRIDAVLGYLATHVPEGIRSEAEPATRDWANGMSDAAWNATH